MQGSKITGEAKKTPISTVFYNYDTVIVSKLRNTYYSEL